MRRFTLMLMLYLAAMAHAEIPDSDSLRIALPDSVPSFLRPATGGGEWKAESEEHSGVFDYDFNYERIVGSATGRWRMPSSIVITPDSPTGLAAWSHGGVYATGSAASMPGMMGVESGSIGLQQQLGSIELSLYGGVDKYGYFNGLQTAYNFGAEATWVISDRWSLTAFGHYSTGLNPLTPGMAGYMTSPRFGGYASYNFSDHWGVSVGAQTVRNTLTGRWEAQPIVTPYYRVSRRVSIGVDAGGILYQMLRGFADHHRHR